jgi:hypothetical protein
MDRFDGGVPIMAGIASRVRQRRRFTAASFATAAIRLMIPCQTRDAFMRHA